VRLSVYKGFGLIWKCMFRFAQSWIVVFSFTTWKENDGRKLLNNALSNYIIASTRTKFGCFSHLQYFPNIFLRMLKIASNLVCLSFPNGWLGVANAAPKNTHTRIASQKYGSMKKWIGLCRVERLFLKSNPVECRGFYFFLNCWQRECTIPLN